MDARLTDEQLETLIALLFSGTNEDGDIGCSVTDPECCQGCMRWHAGKALRELQQRRAAQGEISVAPTRAVIHTEAGAAVAAETAPISQQRRAAQGAPRKPFRLDVSKEWCERMAASEEGHDVSAGSLAALPQPSPQGQAALVRDEPKDWTQRGMPTVAEIDAALALPTWHEAKMSCRALLTRTRVALAAAPPTRAQLDYDPAHECADYCRMCEDDARRRGVLRPDAPDAQEPTR